MTIEETITRYKKLAEYYRDYDGEDKELAKVYNEDADQCDQFAAWLEELVELRKVRPQGEWIVSGYIDTCRGYVAKCSFCEEDTIGGGDFCKNCGAKMKGVRKNEH